MFARLHSFLTSQNLLYENQYGFRKYHSTSRAINYSVDHVESCLSKAFDTISHDKLLHILNNYSVRGNSLELIKCYLTNRLQYVSALGEKSNKLPVRV